ncbi:exported hypothetical protein [Gammaproteobacteria bacterium]
MGIEMKTLLIAALVIASMPALAYDYGTPEWRANQEVQDRLDQQDRQIKQLQNEQRYESSRQSRYSDDYLAPQSTLSNAPGGVAPLDARYLYGR